MDPDLNLIDVIDHVASLKGSMFRIVLSKRVGGTILRACKNTSIIVELCVAETMSVRWCLEMTKYLNWDNILIRYDALTVVDCIQGHSVVVEIDPIMDDCLCTLSNFSYTIVFCKT